MNTRRPLPGSMSPSRDPAQHSFVLPGVAALLGLVSASLIRVGHDEAYWTAIAGMVRYGADLYDTAIDNRSPLVYVVFGALDVMPGPFTWWRGATVGVVLATIGLQARRVLPDDVPDWIICAALVTAGLSSTLYLTIELLALAGLMLALASAACVAAVAAAGLRISAGSDGGE
jgi:hypothetical protein